MGLVRGETRPHQTVSLKEAAQWIELIGDTRVVIVRGEMGIGKTTILKELAKRRPKHIPCYVDMTTKDIGDLLAPKFVKINGMDVMQFIANAEFGLQHNQPLIIMWDEFTKANKVVQTQCIRALQEWQLGEHKFPPGTIQFATGNLSEEGLLDALQPHHANRAMQIVVRKPNDTEWIQDFAIPNNIHPTVIQSVRQFPQMLASYQDYKTPGENPYIYDPERPMPAVVTPRSLESVSVCLWRIEEAPEHLRLSYDAKVHGIAGLVGERAAADIMSVDVLNSELPPWEAVATTPDKAPVPTSAGAQCLFVYSAIQKVAEDTATPLIKYLSRMPLETQALFATTVLQTTKAAMLMDNKSFFSWAQENNWMLKA